MPGVLSDAQVVNIGDQVTDVPGPVGHTGARAPASPRRNVKSKRMLSGDANVGDNRTPRTRTSEDSGEDDNATLPKTLTTPARCRRRSTAIPRSRRTTTSNPADILRSPSPLRRASLVPPANTGFGDLSVAFLAHHLVQCHTLHHSV